MIVGRARIPTFCRYIRCEAVGAVGLPHLEDALREVEEAAPASTAPGLRISGV